MSERLPGMGCTSDQLRRELALMYQQGRFTEAKLPHETIRALLDSWDALAEARAKLREAEKPKEFLTVRIYKGNDVIVDANELLKYVGQFKFYGPPSDKCPNTGVPREFCTCHLCKGAK
jgi:hypothetical protein